MSTELPTGPLHSLAAQYYTDPGIYQQARDQIFYRTWQYACHSSQLPNAGDYVAFSLFDENLFAVRQKDGSVAAFFNVCMHRAHPLVEGDGNARSIVCPYHAWTYNLDGSLRGARGAAGVAGFDNTAIRLTGVQCEVFCGFVFVNLDHTAASMTETFPGVEDAIRAHCPDIEDRALAHTFSAHEHSNWLVAVENYNECYHCKVVHPTFASGVIDPGTYNIKPTFPGVQVLEHSADAQAGDGAWYDTSGAPYASYYLWPAFSLQLYPGGLVNTYHWQPTAVDDTVVHRGWYSADGTVDDTLQTVIDLDRDTTFAEDLLLVKAVQSGLNSRGYVPGPLIVNQQEGIDSEHSIAALQHWMRDAIDD